MPGPGGVCSGGFGPGGAWSEGGGLLRGVPALGGVPGGDPPGGRLLLRAVRILLECILVDSYDFTDQFRLLSLRFRPYHVYIYVIAV